MASRVPGQQVGPGDHLPPADGVEQVAERQRADEVAEGEEDEVVRRCPWTDRRRSWSAPGRR